MVRKWITLGCLVFAVSAPAATAVSRVRAVLQSGQTFITWEQGAGEGLRYRVYRSSTPFRSPEDLTPARLVVEVNDQTSLNLMASIDRLKLSNTRPPAEYKIPKRVHFVIRDGAAPLGSSTGLFVYTAKANETAYYAVTAVEKGNELRVLEDAVTAGIAERVEPPVPVRQNELDYVHWTDSVGTKYYPAMSSVPGIPYNFRLRAPAGKGPHPLIGFLHGAFFQYSIAQVGGEAEASSVRIAFDSPVMRGTIKGLSEEQFSMGGWYGYNENFGTGKPLSEGKVVDYVVRRVLWTLEWAERAFSTDPDRVSLQGGSMGGIGVVVVGLLHPERFAAVHAFIPPLRMGGMMGNQPNPMMPIIPADYVAQHPEKDYPYIMYTAGRTDNIVGWPDKLEFAKALQAVKAGFTFYWDLRWHDQNYTGKVPESLKEPPVPWGRTPARPQMPVISFSRKQSFPAISKLSVDSDPGTVNFAMKPAERPPLETPGAGDLIGTINGAVAWERDSITDTPRRYEITLRLMPFAGADNATATITPRRMQQFRPAAGRNCHYRVTDAGSKRVLLQGETKPDSSGRVSVEQVPITKTGIRLAVW